MGDYGQIEADDGGHQQSGSQISQKAARVRHKRQHRKIGDANSNHSAFDYVLTRVDVTIEAENRIDQSDYL